MKLVVTILVLTGSLTVSAQVVHNFEMGPENTDCGRLDSLELPEQAFADSVLASTFRVKREMTVSQFTAPRRFVYASCDGKSGYLLVFQDDTQAHVYLDVSPEAWEKIDRAKDPRETFREMKATLKRMERKKAP